MKIKRMLSIYLVVMMLTGLFALPANAEDGPVYLSDLPMQSYSWLSGSKLADGTETGVAPGIDKTITAGVKISIADIVYDKGLCYHPGNDGLAEITYDISGKGYTTFTSVAGKDVEATTNGGAVQFFVLLDGEVAAQSDKLMPGDSHTFNVDVTGKNTITLRVTDGGDGIAYDTSSWGNPALSSAKGEVIGISLSRLPKQVYTKGEEIAFFNVDVITTYDNGLTSRSALTSAQISGYDADKLGKQEVTVTGTDGKTCTFPVYVVEDMTYISDIDWVAASAHGTVTPSKDTNINGGQISIAGNTFDKGLGTHPDDNGTAEFKYDLTSMDYTMFSAFVGKDIAAAAAVGEEGVAGTLIQFEIVADGEVVASTTNIPYGDGYWIFADITGAKELILRVNAGDNIFCDAASFGDAMLSKVPAATEPTPTPDVTPDNPTETPDTTPEVTPGGSENNPSSGDEAYGLVFVAMIVVFAAAFVILRKRVKN